MDTSRVPTMTPDDYRDAFLARQWHDATTEDTDTRHAVAETTETGQ